MIFCSKQVFQCLSTDLTIDGLVIDAVLVLHVSCNVGFVVEIVANSTLHLVCKNICTSLHSFVEKV